MITTKRKMTLLIILVLFSLFGAGIISYGGSAQAEADKLFTAAPGSAALGAKQEQAKQDPTIVRSRYVQINFDLLEEKIGLPTQQEVSIVLNLFDDVSFTVQKEQIKKGWGGRTIWKGRIDGIKQSSVILTFGKGGTMFGSIRTHKRSYQIRSAGNGIYAIYEIDQSAFPNELPPILVEIPDTADSIPLEAQDDDGSIIDALVVYTQAAADASPDIIEEIITAVEETNDSYANSNINQILRLVAPTQVSYTESGLLCSDSNPDNDLDRLQDPSDTHLDNVHQLRDKYRADVVSLWVEEGDACGCAYMMDVVSPAFENHAFSVVARGCATGYYSFGHELGHNMSARHDWFENGVDNSPYTYNHGYVDPNKNWRTVMAYGDNCDNCDRLQYWSNPNVDHPDDGTPMGVEDTGQGCPDPTDPDNCPAENYRTLNNTAYTVANFRVSRKWETLVEDTRLTYNSATSTNPRLGLDSEGNVHIVWEDRRDGNYEIYYTKLDGSDGSPLVADTRVTSNSAFSMYPSLGVDSSGNVHIVWHDGRDGNAEIYYTKLDGSDGSPLVADTRVTSDSGNSFNPSLGVDSSGNVHIAWQDHRDGNGEIYYTKLDGSDGSPLVEDTRLTFGSTYSSIPSLGVDSSSNIHITWVDNRDGSYEIYYTKLDGSDGSTLVDDTRLTSSDDDSLYSSLGVDNTGNIHIAWTDHRDGSYEIYYTKLDNDGNTLVDDTRLTFDSAFSLFPSLGVDSSGNVHISWTDWRDGNTEIYYTKLDNDGNILVEDIRLTSDSADSYHPDMGVDSSGNIHIVWYDNRDGNDEIYYTKGRIRGSEPTLTISTNQPSYTTDETMEASLEIVAGTEPAVADLYISITFPGGSPTRYYLNPGWSTTPAPAISSWTVTDWGPTVFFSHTFSGTETPGSYEWQAGFTEPGASNIIGEISAATFTFSP